MKANIRIKNVTVSYRENTALKNVSLNIPAGSFVSIIGPNGAGKTTLLTVINGLGKIITGSVDVFDLPLQRKHSSAIRKNIGYVPQRLNVDPRSPISVKEAVSIGRFGKIGLFGKWTDHDEQIVWLAMEETGIQLLAEKPIGHLSGGEHQKVALARALAQEPEIILLDEPTSNLDPQSQNEILRLIEKIYAEKKYTVVFVTHILSHIPVYCNLAVFMKKGAIVNTGNPAEIMTDNLLSELYDCRIEMVLVNGKRHFHVEQSHQ